MVALQRPWVLGRYLGKRPQPKRLEEDDKARVSDHEGAVSIPPEEAALGEFEASR